MPRLSDSMEEGTIIKWLKQPGDEVRVGDPLADIETDKATVTYEADDRGFLQILAGEGDTLQIGATIARLLESAEAAKANGARGGAAVPPAVEAPAGAPASAAESPPPGPSAPVAAASSRIKASPVARRIAGELGIDLATLVGSGPEGRIVKADVLAAGSASPLTAPPPAAAVLEPASATAKGEVTIVEPTRAQALIARRMASAKATIPEFTVTIEVDADPALEFREQLRNAASPVPSVNDLIVKACALALRVHPNVNAAYVDGHFERYSRVNIGVAVAADGTLVVPTVFDADLKSLIEIAAQTRQLASQVRDGTVAPADLSGGTFTVSNLGMLAVARFTAVINPPQAAILAVGAATPRATVGPDGAIVVRRVMEMTLSADHRIVYGAEAAQFLQTVRKRLERPAALLL